MATQPANGSAVTPAAFADMPAGTFHYTMVSTSSGGKGCTQSVQISSMGEGKQPRVINTSSGDCGAAPSGAAPADATAVPGAAPVKPVAYEPAKPAGVGHPVI